MLPGDRAVPSMPRLPKILADVAADLGLGIRFRPEKIDGKHTGRTEWQLHSDDEFHFLKKSGSCRRPESVPGAVANALHAVQSERLALAACMAAHPAGKSL
jgi:hypothetical protein